MENQYDDKDEIMENQYDDKDEIKYLYDYQMKLYMQVSKEKKESLYFFTFINTVILLSNVWLEVNYSSTSVPLFLISYALIAMIGCFLCLYWYRELRELRLFHETRFRILLELEKQIYEIGPIRYEWNFMGRYPHRRSPVFNVAVAQVLPLIFLLSYLINLIIINYLTLSLQ